MPGTLFVVATPIGNLEDITARALRVLREVALIAAEDTRRTNILLNRFGITTPTTSLHEYNERAKAAGLVRRLKEGASVALVSDAGTPTLSDPGQTLIRAAIDEGIKVEPIPGPSAAIAAISVSGFPTEAFTFMGFPPTRSTARKRWFDQLRKAGHTVVFYESPHRIVATLEDLRRAIGDQAIVAARELTKAHEELVRGPITSVLSRVRPPRGEFTIVVDIGHMPELGRPEAEIEPSAVRREFGELTKNPAVTRRHAIATLSRRHGIPAKRIYELLEASKDSGL